MLWGTGALRSGTLSLAQMIGGRHEPGEFELWPFYWTMTRSPLDEDAGDNFGYFHARRLILKLVMDAMNQGIPVVDARLEMILPWILKVDKNPRIIVVYRDPVATARSWRRFRFLTEHDPYRDHHVREGDTWEEQAASWWNDTYRRILGYSDQRFEFVRCEELPVHEHESKVTGRVEPMTVMQEDALREMTKEVYDALEIARERMPRPAWRELMTEIR